MTLSRVPGLMLAFVAAGLSTSPAAVRMPVIFGDHMVLQQNAQLPIWGWAAPGEKITVTLGAESATTTAQPQGDWRVDLPPMAVAAKQTPLTLTVAGTNTLTFHDVLVGDVWVASGQSNMEFGVALEDKAKDQIAKANEPLLRIFLVAHKTAFKPQSDSTSSAPRLEGLWEVCTPDTLTKVADWGGFTAVGYFFGHEIQQHTGRPVGIIGTYWGGTPAQAWTSLSGLGKDPALAHYVSEHDKAVADYPQLQAAFPKAQADYEAAQRKWDDEVGTAFSTQHQAWAKTMAAARAEGKEPPLPEPHPSRPAPTPPPAPDGGPNSPGNLFNGMVAPIIPYAIKGAIWYQGEANAGSIASSEEYRTLFPRMISDWREKWAQGDFPFLFVQLASFGAPSTTPTDGTWPYLREAQAKTLALPNTGMALALDVGNPDDIHPADKFDVAQRLALAARHVAYGENLLYSGPTFDSMQVQGGRIVLSFANVGSGLRIGGPPWLPYGQPVKQPTELTGFGIAGADKNFVWAKAVIDGDKVIVSSDKVPAPVAVRYGWGQTPPVDLYNSGDLPAVPFRTDHWD